MSKKNKEGNKGVSAKAARNLEALKKAKEAAEKKETTEKAVETKQEEQPKTIDVPGVSVNSREGGLKNCLPLGKTAYETFTLCRKSPLSAVISRKTEEINGVKHMRTVFKNNNTKETLEVVFPVSDLNPDKDISILKEIEEIENPKTPIPAKEPEKKETKVEPKVEKKEKKKETKKTTTKTKKEVKVEEVDAEIVTDSPEIKIPGVPNNSPNLNKSSKNPGDRIDANHGIDLLNMLNRRRDEIRETNPAAHQASGKQADLMMWHYLQIWNNQFAEDTSNAGFKVSPEMKKILDDTASLFLGIRSLPSKTVDGQLTIDFTETMQQVPEETRKAIEQDAATVSKPKEEVKIPTAKECTTDEQKLNAIRLLANVKGDGIGKNLENIIEFAKETYSLGNDAEPAQALALVITKFKEANQSTSLFEGLSNAVFGNLTGNMSSLAAHGWLKSKLNVYNDNQIANITKVFLAKKVSELAAKEGKDDKELLSAYGALLGGMNDDLINRIIKSANNDGKDDEKLVYSTIKGLDMKGKHIAAVKVVNNIKLAYGSEISDKLMKQQMQKITMLYAGKKLDPLATYVEKSAYATKKK